MTRHEKHAALAHQQRVRSAKALLESSPDYPATYVEIHDELEKLVARVGTPIPAIRTPERLVIACARLEIHASAYHKLVTSLETQKAFEAILAELANNAWREYTGSSIYLLPPGLVGAEQWGVIDKRINHWKGEGYRTLKTMLSGEQDQLRSSKVAKEAVPPAREASEAKTSQFQQTNIYGDVKNLAVASSGFSQTNYAGVQQGDIESLRNYLIAIGIKSEDIAGVTRDLESAPTHERMQVAKNWLKDLTSKAASKTGELVVSTAIKLATKGLFDYLGIALPGG